MQIFSTVHACGKHDVNCAISIGMPLNLIEHYRFSNSHERIAITYKKGTVKVIPWKQDIINL